MHYKVKGKRWKLFLLKKGYLKRNKSVNIIDGKLTVKLDYGHELKSLQTGCKDLGLKYTQD